MWKLRFVMCIVLHLDCEKYSIRFHFERVWNGKDKEKWGVISAWKGNDDSGEWRCECKGECIIDAGKRVNHFQWIGPTRITQRSLRGGECFHYGILQST